MTPEPRIEHCHMEKTYNIYEKVLFGFHMEFKYELSDNISLKEISLEYGEAQIPFYTGKEALLGFAHRLTRISELDTQNNKYEYSEEYKSYAIISDKGNDYLNITFQMECPHHDPYERIFEDVTVSLTKEECYLLAQKLLSLLETSHLRNK